MAVSSETVTCHLAGASTAVVITPGRSSHRACPNSGLGCWSAGHRQATVPPQLPRFMWADLDSGVHLWYFSSQARLSAINCWGPDRQWRDGTAARSIGGTGYTGILEAHAASALIPDTQHCSRAPHPGKTERQPRGAPRPRMHAQARTRRGHAAKPSSRATATTCAAAVARGAARVTVSVMDLQVYLPWIRRTAPARP